MFAGVRKKTEEVGQAAPPLEAPLLVLVAVVPQLVQPVLSLAEQVLPGVQGGWVRLLVLLLLSGVGTLWCAVGCNAHCVLQRWLFGIRA